VVVACVRREMRSMCVLYVPVPDESLRFAPKQPRRVRG
jgi:hypothetical protein